LAKSKLSIHGCFRHLGFSFLQKTARAEMGSLWLADLFIPILSSRTGEKKRGTQKTEIHSMMGAVDLKDFPHPQGIEQVRHCDDNSEQKIEQ
jgi:hypothetical protein